MLVVGLRGLDHVDLRRRRCWATLFARGRPVVGVGRGGAARPGRHEGGSFAATAVAIGGVVAGLFANLYPNVMVSTTDPAYNLTVQSTASAHYALKVMTIVALVLFPVVLVYQGWTY